MDLDEVEEAKVEVPIFSLDELAEFEAEMEQAFSAVGNIDPESKVDLSIFGNEWSSKSDEKPIDPAVMTMELNVSDLEDLEDISGVFDSVSDLTVNTCITILRKRPTVVTNPVSTDCWSKLSLLSQTWFSSKLLMVMMPHP